MVYGCAKLFFCTFWFISLGNSQDLKRICFWSYLTFNLFFINTGNKEGILGIIYSKELLYRVVTEFFGSGIEYEEKFWSDKLTLISYGYEIRKLITFIGLMPPFYYLVSSAIGENELCEACMVTAFFPLGIFFTFSFLQDWIVYLLLPLYSCQVWILGYSSW